MKSQMHNKGELKELRVKIEAQVVDNLEKMALKTAISLDDHVVIALKRYQARHSDYLDKAPEQE